jgi:DNA polymerase III subunit beta
MKFVVQKNEILEPLTNIQGLTNRKSNLAITSTVLIRASGESITLSATDLETGFEGVYSAEVETEGVIAINAKKLFEIVRDFPSETLLVDEVENHWIEISNDKIQYHIVGMNPDDFPDIPRMEDVLFFDMEAGHFKKMIERTIYISGASDDKRTHITGCFLEKIETDENIIVRLVSTDGGRLAKMDYIYGKNTDIPLDKGVLVPKKGLQEGGKFLKSEGIVRLGIKDQKFIMQKDHQTIITRLLEGEFPEYREIILKEDENDILMDRQLFLMMLKRMSILSSDSYRAVMFKFGDEKLKINSTNPELGESKEDMAIDYKGKELDMAFNPRFFIEAMNVIDEEQVKVNISDASRPCLIEGGEDRYFTAAIMPMRV